MSTELTHAGRTASRALRLSAALSRAPLSPTNRSEAENPSYVQARGLLGWRWEIIDSMPSTGTLRVGTSGYQYDHWKGLLYPEEAPKSRWLDIYAETFGTVEINNTFYNLPRPSKFDAWRGKLPQGFCMALKFSRYGTHLKHLKDPDEYVERFVSRAERLGRHLGPILVQLHPQWHLDRKRLAGFLEAIPRRVRWSIEFRDASWFTREVYRVFERYRVALCIHDMLPDHPLEFTTNWTYLRFHGPRNRRKFAGSYPYQRLVASAKRVRTWLKRGRDVYVYFNNDERGHAVNNARDFIGYIDNQ